MDELLDLLDLERVDVKRIHGADFFLLLLVALHHVHPLLLLLFPKLNPLVLLVLK